MFAIKQESSGSSERVVLRGEFVRSAVPEARKHIRSAIESSSEVVELDLGGVTRVDSAAAALLKLLYQYSQEHNTALVLSDVSDAATAVLKSVVLDTEESEKKEKRPFTERFGEKALERWDSFYTFLSLTADTFIWSIAGERRTARVRRGAVAVEANRIGVDSLPIVGLISFLVGAVVALQSAYQLRQFGADIFVANLIGVSMTREMGPLMTAIIIAGRSGAAIAAEIATMSVNEEVDGLRTMGLAPRRYIVVPKFQAITLTMPGLTTFANLLGIVGGFLIAVIYMDLGASAFMNQLFESLVFKDLLTGMVKSVAFAWIIVLIAAHQGFQAYGGAEAVGRVTTSSVVLSIFWVIVADAILNLAFYFET